MTAENTSPHLSCMAASVMSSRMFSTDEIVTAIETVAAGRTYFSTGVSEVLLDRRPSEPANPLTTREQDVLMLLASGKSNRAIAQSLALSRGDGSKHIEEHQEEAWNFQHRWPYSLCDRSGFSLTTLR